MAHAITFFGWAIIAGTCSDSSKRIRVTAKRMAANRAWIFATMLREAAMIAVPIKYVQNRCPGSQDGTRVATAFVSVKCCEAKTAMGRAKNKGPRVKILSVPCACNTPLPSLKMPIAKIDIPAKYGQNTVPGIEAKIHSPKRMQKVGVFNLNLRLSVSMAGQVFPSTREPLSPSRAHDSIALVHCGVCFAGAASFAELAKGERPCPMQNHLEQLRSRASAFPSPAVAIGGCRFFARS